MSDSSPAADRRALLQNALQAINDLQAKLDAVERARTEPIAIVGLSCRFPGGANDPEAYWQLLRDGRDAIREFPTERWPAGQPKPETAWHGGFLDQVDKFEPQFFGISPREAATMDPQQRLVLEVSWEALERAGIPPETLADSQTGVFIGVTTNDYARLVMNVDPADMDVYTATGSALNVVAGRVAYILGLHGPTMAIDTACSSSLVALHLACQSLRNHESDVALAGGVNAILSTEAFLVFNKWGMMAPDGRCKTFDAAADGFVRSEGCGVLVLKRLSDAVAAGDNILALVRGSAVNEDGKSSGLTVPSGLAQQAVIRSALTAAGITPAQISYVETHGTGTALGDPIEVEALGAVLGEGRTAAQPLTIGSVKTNIGHLESASGVAGIIKTVLALQHNELPPHLHLRERSSRIPWPKFAIHIPIEPTPWPEGDEPRRAGVSSFGFSGVNAHIVLEEAPRRATPPASVERPLQLFTLSAKSQPALQAYAQKMAAHWEAQPEISLPDAAHTLNIGRPHFPHRLAVSAATLSDAAAALAAFAKGQDSPAVVHGHMTGKDRPKVAFLFTGQGAQYVGMGRQVYETHPAFRAALDQCDEILRPVLGQSLLSILYSPSVNQAPSIDDTTFTQPALFAVEYALAQLWRAWGVEPQWVMGHSVGEYVAACVAGVFSLEDGLKLIAARGRLMGALPAGGQMAAVFADAAQVEKAIEPYAARVSIGAYNGPDSIVISGDGNAVQEILAHLAAQGIKARALNVSHAFHSPLMEPMLAEFERMAAGIRIAAPRLPLISNLTAQRAGEEMARPDYWRRHVRRPVRFAESIQTLRTLGCTALVEIGPNPTLLSMGQRCWPDADNTLWLPSLRKGQADWAALMASLSALYVRGHAVDWEAFDAPYPRRRMMLPTYPFQRERYWVPLARRGRRIASGAGQSHPLLGSRLDIAATPGMHVWQGELDLSQLAYLDDHRVQDIPVLPLTAYVEMATAAAIEVLGVSAFRVSQVEIKKVLLLPAGAAPVVQVTLTEDGAGQWLFQVFSRAASAAPSTKWTLHASGRLQPIAAESPAHVLEHFDLDAIRARCPEEISGEAFYRRLGEKGNQWGPNFQGIQQVWRGEREALSRVHVPATLAAEVKAYHFHPAVSDASGHVLTATLSMDKSDQSTGGAFVGGGIDEAFTYRPFRGQTLWAYARLRPDADAQTNLVIGDVAVFDETGALISETVGARLWYLDAQKQQSLVENVEDWLYAFQWETLPQAAPAPAPELGTWLLFADQHGVSKALAAHLILHGHQCVCVEPGEAFQQISADAFHVRADQPDDFRRLIEASVTDGRLPLRGILHGWSLETPPKVDLTSATLLAAQEMVLGSVVHLTQALSAAPLPLTPKIWLLTCGAQEVTGFDTAVAVSQSALWGLGRTLAAEHSELWGGLIDLDPSVSDEAAAAQVWQGVTAGDREDQIAFRQGQRYGLRLMRHAIEQRLPSLTCQPDASYLITGGLGGLGRVVAHWLAERGARWLILLSRTPLPPRAEWATLEKDSRQARQVADVLALEAQGIQVQVASVDVADDEQLRAWLKQLPAAGWPALRGVIHAAGLMQYQSLHDHTLTGLRALVRPKVAGAWNLHVLLKDAPLDFFVLFSSTSALLSSPLMGSYAAANAFLDGLARHRRVLGLPALSINWGTWGEAGMAVDFARAAPSRNAQTVTVAGTMTNAQALQALEMLMRQNAPQVGVMPLNWAAWQKQYPAFTKAPLLSHLLRPLQEESTAPSAAPRLTRAVFFAAAADARPLLAQTYVAEQVAAILRLPVTNLDPAQSIATLGLDSLMAVELKNRIEADLGLSIPMVQFLEGPNVLQLTDNLLGRFSTQTDTAASSAAPASTWEEGEL